jgi:hypothetical protein
VSHRLRFALTFAGVSAVLFVIWPSVSSVFTAVASGVGGGIRESMGLPPFTLVEERDSYELIPALGLIFASVGHPVRRKLIYAAALVAAFAALLSIAVVADLITSAAENRPAGVLFFIMLNVVLPLGTVMWFSGRDPSQLWERPEAVAVPVSRCPLCRAAVSSLRDHVSEEHGASALRDPRVRRALNVSRAR